MSNVLTALITIPIFTLEMFSDFITTDIVCKIIRYNNLYYIVVTIMNYLVIGLERYLFVFHPLAIRRKIIWTSLLVSSWFLAAVITLVPMPSYNLVTFKLSKNTYTRTCKYDESTKTKRTFFMTFTLLAYVIPCTILLVTTCKILRFLKRQRQVPEPILQAIYKKDTSETVNIRYSTSAHSFHLRANIDRNKLTRMFVLSILACVIPYLAYIIYGVLAVIFNIQLSFENDYIVRYVTSLISFLNILVGSFIFFYNSRYLRRRVCRLVQSLSQ